MADSLATVLINVLVKYQQSESKAAIDAVTKDIDSIQKTSNKSIIDEQLKGIALVQATGKRAIEDNLIAKKRANEDFNLAEKRAIEDTANLKKKKFDSEALEQKRALQDYATAAKRQLEDERLLHARNFQDKQQADARGFAALKVNLDQTMIKEKTNNKEVSTEKNKQVSDFVTNLKKGLEEIKAKEKDGDKLLAQLKEGLNQRNKKIAKDDLAELNRESMANIAKIQAAQSAAINKEKAEKKQAIEDEKNQRKQARADDAQLGNMVSAINQGTSALRTFYNELKAITTDNEFVNTSKQYEVNLRNFNAVALETETALQGTHEALKALATDEQLAGMTELAKAMRTIQTAGFEGADGLTVLHSANREAAADMSDVAKTAALLTSVLNSYNMTAERSAEISNINSKAIKYGKLTQDELNSSMGTAISLSAEAGVEYSQVAAAMATIHKQGVSAHISATEINAVLKAAFHSGKDSIEFAKSLGIELNSAGIQAKGVGGFVKDIFDKTAKFGSDQQSAIARLIPDIRSLRGLEKLVNDEGKTFNDILGHMRDETDQTSLALEQQTKTFAYLQHQIEVSSETMKIEMGGILQEVFRPFLEALNDIIQLFNSLPKPVRIAVESLILLATGITLTAIAVGGLTVAVGSLMFMLKGSALVEFIALIASSSVGIGIFAIAMGEIILILGALWGAVKLGTWAWEKYFGTVSENAKLDETNNKIKDAIDNVKMLNEVQENAIKLGKNLTPEQKTRLANSIVAKGGEDTEERKLELQHAARLKKEAELEQKAIDDKKKTEEEKNQVSLEFHNEQMKLKTSGVEHLDKYEKEIYNASHTERENAIRKSNEEFITIQKELLAVINEEEDKDSKLQVENKRRATEDLKAITQANADEINKINIKYDEIERKRKVTATNEYIAQLKLIQHAEIENHDRIMEAINEEADAKEVSLAKRNRRLNQETEGKIQTDINKINTLSKQEQTPEIIKEIQATQKEIDVFKKDIRKKERDAQADDTATVLNNLKVQKQAEDDALNYRIATESLSEDKINEIKNQNLANQKERDKVLTEGIDIRIDKESILQEKLKLTDKLGRVNNAIPMYQSATGVEANPEGLKGLQQQKADIEKEISELNKKLAGPDTDKQKLILNKKQREETAAEDKKRDEEIKINTQKISDYRFKAEQDLKKNEIDSELNHSKMLVSINRKTLDELYQDELQANQQRLNLKKEELKREINKPGDINKEKVNKLKQEQKAIEDTMVESTYKEEQRVFDLKQNFDKAEIESSLTHSSNMLTIGQESADKDYQIKLEAYNKDLVLLQEKYDNEKELKANLPDEINKNDPALIAAAKAIQDQKDKIQQTGFNKAKNLTDIEIKDIERLSKVADDNLKFRTISEQQHFDALQANLEDQAIKYDELAETVKGDAEKAKEYSNKASDLRTQRELNNIERVKSMSKTISDPFLNEFDKILPGISKVFDAIINKNEELQKSIIQTALEFAKAMGINGVPALNDIVGKNPEIANKLLPLPPASPNAPNLTNAASPLFGASENMKSALDVSNVKDFTKITGEFKSSLNAIDLQAMKMDKSISNAFKDGSKATEGATGAANDFKTEMAVIGVVSQQVMTALSKAWEVTKKGLIEGYESAEDFQKGQIEILKSMPGILGFVGELVDIPRQQVEAAKARNAKILQSEFDLKRAIIQSGKETTDSKTLLLTTEFENNLRVLKDTEKNTIVYNNKKKELEVKYLDDITKTNQDAKHNQIKLQNETIKNSHEKNLANFNEEIRYINETEKDYQKKADLILKLNQEIERENKAHYNELNQDAIAYNVIKREQDGNTLDDLLDNLNEKKKADLDALDSSKDNTVKQATIELQFEKDRLNAIANFNYEKRKLHNETIKNNYDKSKANYESEKQFINDTVKNQTEKYDKLTKLDNDWYETQRKNLTDIEAISVAGWQSVYNLEKIAIDSQIIDANEKLTTDKENLDRNLSDKLISQATYNTSLLALETASFNKIDELNKQSVINQKQSLDVKSQQERDNLIRAYNAGEIPGTTPQEVLDTYQHELDTINRNAIAEKLKLDNDYSRNRLKGLRDLFKEEERLNKDNSKKIQELNQSNYDALKKIYLSESQKRLDFLKSEIDAEIKLIESRSRREYDLEIEHQQKLKNLHEDRNLDDTQKKDRLAAFNRDLAGAAGEKGASFYRANELDFNSGTDKGNEVQRKHTIDSFDLGEISYDEMRQQRQQEGIDKYLYYLNQEKLLTDPVEKEAAHDKAMEGQKEYYDFIFDKEAEKIEVDNKRDKEKIEAETQKAKDDLEMNKQRYAEEEDTMNILIASLDAKFKESGLMISSYYVEGFRSFISAIEPDISQLGVDLYQALRDARTKFDENDAAARGLTNGQVVSPIAPLVNIPTPTTPTPPPVYTPLIIPPGSTSGSPPPTENYVPPTPTTPPVTNPTPTQPSNIDRTILRSVIAQYGGNTSPGSFIDNALNTYSETQLRSYLGMLSYVPNTALHNVPGYEKGTPDTGTGGLVNVHPNEMILSKNSVKNAVDLFNMFSMPPVQAFNSLMPSGASNNSKSAVVNFNMYVDGTKLSKSELESVATSAANKVTDNVKNFIYG